MGSRILLTRQAALVPHKELFRQDIDVDIGLQFFRRTLGKITVSEAQTVSIFSSFKALSAISNIIVFTFTAARGNTKLTLISIRR
jgi:hypothetical protein